MRAHCLQVFSRLPDLRRDRRAVAAVEFALLLPVMVTLYLGSVEVFQGIATKRNVTMTSHALGDLATQYTTIHDSDMTTIFSAGSAVMSPYSTSTLKVTVSEIAIDSKGNATVAWSSTQNGTALTVGQSVTIPSGLAVANTYLIFSQVQYTYNPTFGYVLTGKIALSDQIYMSPRQSSSIARVSP